MVAVVSPFPITVFPGFGITITPVSKRKVFVLFGTLFLTGQALNGVTEELQKLFGGLSAAEMVTPCSRNLSFWMGRSPSKAANAKWALTGVGPGTVGNPDTGISTFTELLIEL